MIHVALDSLTHTNNDIDEMRYGRPLISSLPRTIIKSESGSSHSQLTNLYTVVLRS